MMKKKRSARRIERRRSTRADARLSMRVESAPAEGERTQIVTETQNISANGVYCSSLHYLAPASKVANLEMPMKASPLALDAFFFQACRSGRARRDV